MIILPFTIKIIRKGLEIINISTSLINYRNMYMRARNIIKGKIITTYKTKIIKNFIFT